MYIKIDLMLELFDIGFFGKALYRIIPYIQHEKSFVHDNSMFQMLILDRVIISTINESAVKLFVFILER